jgi:Leucine-rich repeat (LRR) protein
LLILPKRNLKNGIITDYPPEQRFDIQLTDGQDYAVFIFPDGKTSIDTSGVTMPIKLFVGTRSSVQLSWKIFALQVDTSNDHVLRQMSNKEMFRKLSAPNNEVKSYMIVHAGYLQLYAKNYEGARECFNEALALDSSQKSTFYYNIACSYARENKTPEALQWLHFAFNNGFDKYNHALKKDSDLVSIRSLPEFIKIVTAPLVKQRREYFESLRKNPSVEYHYYPLICQSYLNQCDIDSFYVYFKYFVEKGNFPSILDYNDPDSIITRDPRSLVIFEKYMENHRNHIFKDYEVKRNPYVISRMECNVIPDEISKCINLSELRILSSANCILPPELAEFKRFRILHYINCGFVSFPEVITRCKYLDTLTSERGGAKFLPDAFGNLINLKHLALRNGLLESLPVSFGNLSSLTNLSLANNSFYIFPQVLTKLYNIRKLDLSSNSIAVIPDDIQMLSQIDTMMLSDNQLKSIPAAIGTLKNLVYLDLSQNYLKSIPEEIGSLTQLTYLDLSFNEFERIPGSIKDLKSLRTLIIYGNFLSNLELEELRKLLPKCNIFGKEQNVFKLQKAENTRLFSEESFGLSFEYPSRYKFKTQINKPDSTKIVFFLNCSPLVTKDKNSYWDMLNPSGSITLLFTKKSIEELAEEFAFHRNPIIDSAENLEIDSVRFQTLWLSWSRTNAGAPTSAINFNGWKGFYGTSDDGEKESFFFIARKKFTNEKTVSLVYSGKEKAEHLLQIILSSFQLGDKSKSSHLTKRAFSAKGKRK